MSWASAQGADSSSQRTTLRDLAGNRVDLAAPANGVTVLVFYSTECPISNSYSPTLRHLIDSFPGQVGQMAGRLRRPRPDRHGGQDPRPRFQLEVPGRPRPAWHVRPQARRQGDARGVRDRRRREGPLSRPDRRPVRRPPQAQRQSLGERAQRHAIAAVLNGKEVKAPYVEPVGCPLPEVPTMRPAPTYCKDVAPILQKNCQECHRPGQVGPFCTGNLRAGAETRRPTSPRWSRTDAMPPWKADPTCRRQVQGRPHAVRARRSRPWSPGPRPMLPRATRPTCRSTPKFPDDWQLGTPDLVIDIGADFAGPGRRRRHLSLLRRADSPREGSVCLGRRVPAGQSPGRPSHPGLRRHLR